LIASLTVAAISSFVRRPSDSSAIRQSKGASWITWPSARPGDVGRLLEPGALVLADQLDALGPLRLLGRRALGRRCVLVDGELSTFSATAALICAAMFALISDMAARSGSSSPAIAFSSSRVSCLYSCCSPRRSLLQCR
jgi:hypothetical protein